MASGDALAMGGSSACGRAALPHAQCVACAVSLEQVLELVRQDALLPKDDVLDSEGAATET